jgi:hypothetical protein
VATSCDWLRFFVPQAGLWALLLLRRTAAVAGTWIGGELKTGMLLVFFRNSRGVAICRDATNKLSPTSILDVCIILVVF